MAPKVLECFQKDGNYDKGRIAALVIGVAIFAGLIWLIVLSSQLQGLTGNAFI